MDITPEQAELGKDNFNEAVGVTRRSMLKTAAAGGVGLGALYFNYEKLNGKPVRAAFIGCGDEANVLMTEHPSDYMELVAIADPRPANVERSFTGSHPEARIGLNKKLGQARASEVKVYASHRELLKDAQSLGLEMVVIAVPLSQHAPIALECLDAGLHVLTEKLMAHNITECKQMIRKAEEMKYSPSILPQAIPFVCSPATLVDPTPWDEAYKEQKMFGKLAFLTFALGFFSPLLLAQYLSVSNVVLLMNSLTKSQQ